jgi:hypothetical protein
LPSGLRIFDMQLIVAGNGRAWVNLPSKPRLDQGGRHMHDERGKPVYLPMLGWRDRGIGDAFSERVVALMRVEHPEAFQ